jgi:HAD superfamily hydrolase (TIGR01662 family)
VSFPQAVFFDVDFTLIYPGPMFQPEGYQRFCLGFGLQVDASKFHSAVAGASRLLAEEEGGLAYDPQRFVEFIRELLRGMGGHGERLDECAWTIYYEWAACQHFSMYDDVADVLREIHAAGVRIGLISNTHRCLETFQQHFELQGLITAAVSSLAHGFMKPHPSIFEAAMQQIGVASPAASVMVGDSLAHDIEGARRIGMRGVLVIRSGDPGAVPPDVAVIRSLRELPVLLGLNGASH